MPDAELRVGGAVSMQVDDDDPTVKVMGRIDDLAAAYGEARRRHQSSGRWHRPYGSRLWRRSAIYAQ